MKFGADPGGGANWVFFFFRESSPSFSLLRDTRNRDVLILSRVWRRRLAEEVRVRSSPPEKKVQTLSRWQCHRPPAKILLVDHL